MARQARLIWTAPALDDLDEIASYIAADDAAAAAKLVGKVLDAVEHLRSHPEAGRLVPELTGRIYREVIVPPCRIVYRREGKAIVIIHVFRGERQLRRNRLI